MEYEYLVKKLKEDEVKKIYCRSSEIFAILKNKKEIKIPPELITEIICEIKVNHFTTYSTNTGEHLIFLDTNLEQLKKCIDYI